MKKDVVVIDKIGHKICAISPASPEVAEDIYALKVAAFHDYLIYTIYQSPRSVVYLRDLTVHGTATGHLIFVANYQNRVVGYYHAFQRGSELFLNYIAVANEVRGLGIGTQLLEHYEIMARTLGCETLALDIFESNSDVYQWYRKMKYEQRSVSSLALLGLGWEDKEKFHLDFSLESWNLAHQEEYERGFSKMECACGPGTICVGLIAERMCKLISCERVAVEYAVPAINARFRETRDALIVSTQKMPLEWPILAFETVITLCKPL